MRRVIGGVAAVAVAVAAYGTLDVLDIAPGVLTRQTPRPVATPTAEVSDGAAAEPLPSAPAAPTTPSATSGPTPAGLAAVLGPLVTDPRLGPSVGVSVRDGVTGEELYAVDAATARTPASAQKLLSAYAVATTLDGAATMSTRTVTGAKPGDVVLVAGGDTLLAKGKGAPTSVAGRAGLADLADQTATALDAAGVGAVRLRLDLSYAEGPSLPPGWNPVDVQVGYAQGVAMVGLAAERPKPGEPSPPDPAASVAREFARLLAARGHRTTLAARSTWGTPAPEGAAELAAVESAPYADVLALALATSDNALTENLVRQAMDSEGIAVGDARGVGAFIAGRLKAGGVTTTGIRLTDASGLGRGQRVSAETISQVLATATTTDLPAMRTVVAGLPVAGLTGTLAERFVGAGAPARGVARAKTGTLDGVGSLAGVTVDQDGRPLTFVILADRVPTGWAGREGARASLDRVVAALTGCGCR